MKAEYLKVVRQVERRLLSIGPRVKFLPEKHIVLLPYWFAQSLGGGKSFISPNFLSCLAAANLYGWMAYDIYDDFLDSEGNPVSLPLANVCLREVVNIYNIILPGNYKFFYIFQAVMDRVDIANSWEQGNTRIIILDGKFKVPQVLPNFGNIKHLADRSIGHALGPLAILFKLGFAQDSFEVNQILKFFEYYLAARQLSDDAHDWWEDLEKGFLNGASVRVLSVFGQFEVNLIKDKENLHKIFWLEVVPEILTTINKYLTHCRKTLGALAIIKKPARLLEMVNLIEKSVERTRLQQQKIEGLF